MNAKKKTPLLLVTMDGVQEKWVMDWCKEGSLPTIASLIKEGSHGRIKSAEQYMEYGTELSLFSGVSRAEHGYYHYRGLEKGTYKLNSANPHLAKSLPFWATLPKTTKVAMLDMVELPLVEELNGIQLANWVAHQSIIPPLPPISIPKNLVTEVKHLYGERDKTSEYKADATFEDDLKSYQAFLRQIKRKGKLIRQLIQKDDFDIVATAFYEVHRAGHRLWSYNPDVYKKDDELKDCFKNLYKAVDRELQLILETFNKEVNVFFLSPFEMKTQYPTGGLMEDFCHKLGYKKEIDQSNNTNSFSFSPLEIARKIIPESLRIKISQKLGSKMQERLLSAKLEETTDWANTSLFAYPTVYTGLMRINLKGREPQGIVESEKEYVALLEKVKKDLFLLTDPETGEPAVVSITCPYELYGNKIPESLPDFFVEWREKPTFLAKVDHPKCTLTQQKPAYFRNSWHKFQGFWAAKGPDILFNNAPQVKGLLDFVPTFKGLLNTQTKTLSREKQ